MRRDLTAWLLSEGASEYRQFARHKQKHLNTEIQRQIQAARPEFLPLLFPDPSPPTSWWKGVRKTVTNSGRAENKKTKLTNKKG